MKLQSLTTKHFILFMAVAAFSLASCSKEGCTDPEANNYDEKADEDDGSCTFDAPEQADDAAFYPVPRGADAVLVAVNTISDAGNVGGGFGGDTEIKIGTAVGVFFGSNDQQGDAGTVSTEDKDLDFTNNVYINQISQSDPMGIDFGSEANWEVSGSGSTGFPAFNYETTVGFPETGEIISEETVNRNEDYDFRIESIDNADSLYFTIAGSGGERLIKREPGTTTEVFFSSSELENLESGDGIIQVAAARFENTTESGETVWFVNEEVRTVFVEIN